MVRVFAPFTPFLTEYMYQNMRHLVEGEVQESVHYVMIPDPRKDLIDIGMERAVSRFATPLSSTILRYWVKWCHFAITKTHCYVISQTFMLLIDNIVIFMNCCRLSQSFSKKSHKNVRVNYWLFPELHSNDVVVLGNKIFNNQNTNHCLVMITAKVLQFCLFCNGCFQYF